MITKNSITETEATIAWYKPPMKIRHAMRKLAKAGFSDSGHGAGFGVEDWSMIYHFSDDKYIYVLLSYNKIKKKQTVSYSVYFKNSNVDFLSPPEFEPRVGINKAISLRDEILNG
jgi:hypothetical protein